MNEILKFTERHSCSTGLRICFSKKEVHHRVSRFFTKTGILGMLEAADYKQIDLLSPFVEEIVDVCYRNSKTAPVPGRSTLYVDLLNKIFQKIEYSGRIEEKLLNLQGQIKNSREIAKRVFEVYRASNMETSNLHTLSHFMETLRQVGSMAYVDAGIFESSQAPFKKYYRHTSKTRRMVVDETLS